MKQWDVKREMLRRIKRRFDELGIEIPFPQRTVWVREESGAGEGAGGRGQRTEDRGQENITDSIDPTN
jgi:small conductance mechanosensitive channel